MTPTFRPVKNCGSALGRRTCHSSWSLVAPIVRSRFIVSGSAEPRPWIVPTAIAKNVNSATSATFGASPKPNQITTSGASAISGIVCERIISG